MQDRLRHIDRKFTNRAWGEMRQMLDREMPTTERRRSGIVWWWLLPLGLLLGVAAWGFLRNGNFKPAAPAVVSPSQPIANEPASTPADGDSNTNSKASIKSENQGGFTQTTQPQNAKLSPQRAENQTIAPSLLPKSRRLSKVATQLANQGGSAVPNENSLPQNSGGNWANMAKTEADISTETPAKTEARLPDPLPWNAWVEITGDAKMPSLRLLDFQQNPLLTSPAEVELPVEKPQSARSRFSFFAGGMAAATNLANGLAMGSTAAFPLKDSRLSLEGGLGYALVQQPLAVQVNQFPQTGINGDAENSLVYAFNSSRNKSEDNYASQTNYSTGVYLHYFQAPVSLRYRLLPDVSLHGGAAAAYLMDLSQGGYDQIISLDAGGNSATLSESYDSVKIPLSRFDLATTGGMTWQFAPALALDFQYRMGVKDLLKSNGMGDYNRLFQLSIRYEVKSKKVKGKS